MTVYEPPTTAASLELPVHLTRFVGRDRELDDLTRLVDAARLVTLTGAGGSGKTRLARETALRVAAAFDRVVWVDLAPLADADLLAQQVADAFHLAERPGATPTELVIEAVGTTRVLLVLDNCEHLVECCATLTEALLLACPRLTILATSREALGVASETAWLVPPLVSAEAVQLFTERAQATLPSFAQTAANGAAIAEICRRLDGIPLAIELAAARVRVLSPEQIAARLDDAFRLLTGGSRTALPRHRTLRATMEWSFTLLAPREQVLLRRLAAFAGSFTLDAAEAVCADELLEADDILDGVSALVDRSLVVMEAGDGVARYRLLETVRQYGAERLAEAGERETLERRHAEFFLDLVERAAPALVGGESTPGLLARVIAEHDNLRAGVAWSVAAPERVELGLRFVGAMYWYWYLTSQFREARGLIDRALALDATGVHPGALGSALVASGLTAFTQGDYPRSCAQFEAALPLLRAAGDVAGTGAALSKYGAARLFGGDVDGAIATLDEALAYIAGWPPNDIAVIFAKFWRGWAAYVRGDLDLAYELVDFDVAVGRRYGLPTTLAHSLGMLARIELARGRVRECCTLVVECLELEVANKDAWGIGLAIEVVAQVAARRQRLEDATRLLGALEAHRHRLAVAIPGLAREEFERVLAALRAALGPRFDALYAEGLALPTNQMVAMALAEGARDTTEFRVVQAEARPRDPGEPRLRVQALGPLQVWVDDRPIEPAAWGSARPRELLVYLLLHPEGRTKEQVGLAFWPEASTAQLRNSFHVTLHRLRKALGGAEWVTLAGDRYRIDPARIASFDAAALESAVTEARRALVRQQDGAAARLERALDLYRGDLLDGEPVGDWHVEHRERLQRLYIEALMALGAHHTREERHGKAAEAYRRVLARDELYEDALQALMRALAESGERAQALRLYRRFAERLEVELEAAPGRETLRLFESLQTAR